MRRVYCIWQLMFADVINNNELSIMYCDWLCLLYTCMLCWTPDGTYDLIVHLTIVLTDFIIVHLYLACYFSLIPVYIFIVCLHVICTCFFPFILHTHWEFWLPGFAHQVHVYFILLIRYLERIIHFTRSHSSFIWSSLLGILLLSFIHVVPFDSLYWFLFYSFIPMLSLC